MYEIRLDPSDGFWYVYKDNQVHYGFRFPSRTDASAYLYEDKGEVA